MKRFALWLAPLWMACGTPPSEAPITLETPDMADTSDTPADLVTDLPEDMAEPPDPGCQTQWSWKSAGAMAGPGRDHHVTFINARTQPATLHVLGGTNYGGLFSDHWSASIDADTGTLGAWSQVAALPAPRGGSAHASTPDKELVLGGRDRGGMRAEVFASVHDVGGAITGWVEQSPLPEARFHGSAAAHEGYVYFTGGLNAMGQAQSDVFIGALDAQGVLTGWTRAALPQPRSHHASFVHQGALYLVQGFEGNPFQNATTAHRDIQRAEIQADGTLGTWEVAMELPRAISTQSVTRVRDCAYVIAGLHEPTPGAYEYSAGMIGLSMEETLERVEITGALTQGRSHMHQAPEHNGRVYVVGGSLSFQMITNAVEIGEATGP